MLKKCIIRNKIQFFKFRCCSKQKLQIEHSRYKKVIKNSNFFTNNKSLITYKIFFL